MIKVRYGSPTEWNHSKMISDDLSDFFSDTCSDDYLSDSSSKSDSDCRGLRIEFKEDNVAEAIENDANDNTVVGY